MTPRDKALIALQAAGLDARPPAQYAGACKDAYLVVQDGGVQPTGRTTVRRLVVVHGFAPASRPADLQTILANTAAAMKNAPGLKPDGGCSDETVDDVYKAITAHMIYSALCSAN